MGIVENLLAFLFQLLHPYDCTRKSLKWYRKLALHLLQRAMLNSHILYRKARGSLTYKQYQEQVISSLLYPDVQDEPPVAISVPKHSAVTRLNTNHYPAEVPYNAQRKRWLYKKCVVCMKKSEKGKRPVDTRFMCSQCVGEPGLCAAPCFRVYHTKLDFAA